MLLDAFGVFGSGLQRLSGKFLADQGANRFAVGQMPEGAQLAGDVAERRGFDRTGEDRQPAAIGAQLVQEVILAAAADDVDALVLPAGDRGQRFECLAVEEGEALEDAAREFAGGLRFALTGFTTIVGDRLLHRRGVGKRSSLGLIR